MPNVRKSKMPRRESAMKPISLKTKYRIFEKEKTSKNAMFSIIDSYPCVISVEYTIKRLYEGNAPKLLITNMDNGKQITIPALKLVSALNVSTYEEIE